MNKTGILSVAQKSADRVLLQRCLNHEPGAWNDFVDRFLGLIYHVIRHTSHLRSVPLHPEDVEDVAAEMLFQMVDNNYAMLRQFRGNSSLATYLTVIGRRICIHELVKRAPAETPVPADGRRPAKTEREEPPKAQVGLESLEEVQLLLRKLPTREREVVRLFYLEGRSYEEISTELRIPINSIGPVLSRARQKMRKTGPNAPPAKRDQQPRQ